MTLTPTVRGMLSAATACFFFTLFDAATKTLVSNYPLFEVVSAQFLISAALVLLWAKVSQGVGFAAAVKMEKKGLHLLRGLLQFVSNALIALSFMHMSLAEFYVILFLAPIMVAMLAAWLLREKITIVLVIAMIISFIGVVIALRPAGGMSIWALVAFGGTLTNALTTLVLRRMAATETAISPAYSAGIVVGLLSGVVTAFNFVMPTLADFGLMVLAGAIYATAQIFYVRAFRLAPASLAAAAQFLQLVYGVVVGFVVFGDVPSLWIYLGGVVVVAANLFLLYTQNRKPALMPLS